jgi:hypothetical protein
MSQRIHSLRKGSNVLLVDDAEDVKRNGHAFRAAYEEAFEKAELHFVVKPDVRGNLTKGLQSSEYDLVVASSVVWEKLSDEFKASRKLIKPSFDFDRRSLEEARYKVGVLQ